MSEDATLDDFADSGHLSSDIQTNSTELRIGPFEYSLPSEWDTASLSEACENKDGKRVPVKKSKRESMDGKIPYYGASGQIDTVDDFLFDERLLLLAEDGANLLTRNSPIAYIIDGKSWVNNHAHVLKPNEGHNIWYLAGFLELLDYEPFVTGTAQPKLTQNSMDFLKVPKPPLPEQRKIATVLYTVDRAIEKTEEIESQVRRTQNGIVQETLKCGLGESDISDTGTKLGEIPTHWEITSIDEIVADEEHSFTDGARYALSSAEIHDEGEARAILLQEVGEREFNDEDPKFATGEKYEEITHRAIYPGEVVVAKMAEPVARACIVPDKYDKYLLGCADVVRIQTNSEFDSRFLMYCMNSHKVWRQAVAHLRGTGRSRINLENIAELKLPKPPLDEQLGIADTLESFDHRIQTERDYRNSLRRLKHGLMQDLLSGTVRTTDTNIQVPDKIA